MHVLFFLFLKVVKYNMTIYTYENSSGEQKQININLKENSYGKLLSREWDLGFIEDNPGIDETTNTNFYHKEKINRGNGEEEHICFNNKVTVKLCNGSIKTGHMIHWVPSILNKGIFCISYSPFWNTFDSESSSP